MIAGYQLLGLIGAGAMGEVYEAQHHPSHRRVAINKIHGAAGKVPKTSQKEQLVGALDEIELRLGSVR